MYNLRSKDELFKIECEKFPLKKIDQRFVDENSLVSIPNSKLGGAIYSNYAAFYQYIDWRNELFLEIINFKNNYTGDFMNDDVDIILQMFEWSTKALTFEERLDAIEIINIHRVL